MAVKITMEFETVERAIVALGLLSASSEVRKAAATPAAAPVKAAPVKDEAKRGRGRPKKNAGDGTNTTPKSAEKGGDAPSSVTESGSAISAGPSTVEQVPAAATTVPSAPEVAPIAALPSTEKVTDEAVQAAVSKFYTAKDYDATVALLARYGVAKGKDLLQEQRAAFITEVDALLAA